jgi:hypothetical protein
MFMGVDTPNPWLLRAGKLDFFHPLLTTCPALAVRDQIDVFHGLQNARKQMAHLVDPGKLESGL